MARQARTNQPQSTPTAPSAPATKNGGEKIENLSHTPVEDVPDHVGMTKAAAEAHPKPAVVKPSVSSPEDNEMPEGEKAPPPIKRLRVLADGRANIRGNRTLLRAGKVVDSLNYNFNHLAAQGIQLGEVIKF